MKAVTRSKKTTHVTLTVSDGLQTISGKFESSSTLRAKKIFLFIHEYIPLCFGRFEAKADKMYNNYHVAMKNKLGESEETKKAAKH